MRSGWMVVPAILTATFALRWVALVQLRSGSNNKPGTLRARHQGQVRIGRADMILVHRAEWPSLAACISRHGLHLTLWCLLQQALVVFAWKHLDQSRRHRIIDAFWALFILDPIPLHLHSNRSLPTGHFLGRPNLFTRG